MNQALLPDVAQLFKALSEPLRLRILYLLAEAGELCVCDLMQVVDAPQSMVSRHLAYLRGAGLASSRRDGHWMYYRLAEPMPPLARAIVLSLVEHGRRMPELAMDLQRHRVLAEDAASRCAPVCGG